MKMVQVDDHGHPSAAFPDPFGLGFPVTGDPMYALVTTSWGSSNRATYKKWLGSGAITKVGIHVGTSSGNICIANMDGTGSGRSSAPGARSATTGAIPCPASGYAEVALVDTVNPGDWCAMSCDNTTATFWVPANNTLITSDWFKGRMGYEAAAHPVPSTASATYGFARGMSVIGVP